MAKADSIAPFPADIDRDSFGHWLSGFCDGEGCFDLNMSGRRKDGLRTPSGRFSIELRSDDLHTLKLIQSYLRCGGVYVRPFTRNGSDSINAIFRVQKIADTGILVIKHFDRHPLHSKKARDYEYWREAMLLAYNVSKRPSPSLGYAAGRAYKWMEHELHRFKYLMITMRETRKYRPLTMQLP